MYFNFYKHTSLSSQCLASSVFGQAINEKLFFTTIDVDITPIVVPMLEDSQGYIWMVGGGLNKFNPIKDQLTVYNLK